MVLFYANPHHKVTKKGTLKSTTKPWYIDIIEYSFPEVCIMIGKVESMVVAPPAAMGASFPKYLTISGANSKVKISRNILASNAIVPSSIPLYSVIKMLDKE